MGHAAQAIELAVSRFGGFHALYHVAGGSANLELVPKMSKIGGNGPIMARLTAAGQAPKVLTIPVICGKERATQLFESAYDEHAHRLSRLYANVGSKL